MIIINFKGPPWRRTLCVIWILQLFAAYESQGSSLASTSSREVQKSHVQDPVFIRNQTDLPHKTRISVVPEYIIIRQKDLLIGGYGAGVGLNYHRSRHFGFGAQARQLFSTKNLDSLYTAFDFKLMWWPMGFDVRNEHRIIGDRGDPIVRLEVPDSGGFQVDLSIKEVFFNTESGILPMGGFGMALMYQFATQTDISYGLGAGIDRLRGQAGETILTLRGMLQISLLI